MKLDDAPGKYDEPYTTRSVGTLSRREEQSAEEYEERRNRSASRHEQTLKATMSLEQSVRSLRDKLDPVLPPEEPSAVMDGSKSPGPDVDMRSEVEKHHQEHIDALIKLRFAVDNLTERIDL